MGRTVDYESRRRQVLMAAINYYIKEAEPVASEDIAAAFDVSPATIRNIFAELEESGYLTHPHTSGGRIPTDKGYRYYVDFLLREIELLNEEKEHISGAYRHEMRRLEDALEQTTEVISAMTHYAGIVSVIESQEKFFYTGIGYILDQPEFQNYDKIRFLVGMMEDKKQLMGIINRDFSDKVKVYIGSELECPQIGQCSLVVSSYGGKNKPRGKIAVLGPARMEYEHIIPTVEYISDVLTDVLNDLG
jgi:transcriptional regulator of heat shock response